jgi:hypothetical protein
MARNLEAVAGEWVVYVPDIDDNRNDPDPLSVEILPLTAREMREIVNVEAMRGRKSGDTAAAIASAQRKQFVAHVRNVKGYSLGGRPVVEAQDLYDNGEPEVVSDVEAAIQNMSKLSEGDLGKLQARRG